MLKGVQLKTGMTLMSRIPYQGQRGLKTKAATRLSWIGTSLPETHLFASYYIMYGQYVKLNIGEHYIFIPTDNIRQCRETIFEQKRVA